MPATARPLLIAPALILCLALPGKAAAQSLAVSGTVTAPVDAPLEGGKVVACSVPYQICKTKIETPLRRVTGANWAFELKLPNKGPWQLVAWKDSDGDDDASPGDYIGTMQNGGEVVAPPNAVRIAVKKVDGGASAARATGGGGAGNSGDAGALAGSWSQSSAARELVLTSKIKLQPSIATGYGTNLGGTFGAGSATNTVIVTESASLPVRRQMTLVVQPNGSFTWKIDKSYTEGSCAKTVSQEKRGQLRAAGGKLTFSIQGGRESWSSCGKSGSTAISPGSETYDYTLAGGSLKVTGSGGVNWVFRH